MFLQRPELTWKYLLRVEKACRSTTCNAGHRMIARLERRLEKVVVLTQNVDGFHRAAGSSYAGLPNLPRCHCGGVERPDVVLFGETLPDAKMESLLAELSRGFDMVLSVGTSGLFPYIRLPMIRAKVYGWPSVDINPSRSEMTTHASYHLALRAAEACEGLWQRLERKN
jgi:NAD-dependent deacetylase